MQVKIYYHTPDARSLAARKFLSKQGILEAGPLEATHILLPIPSRPQGLSIRTGQTLIGGKLPELPGISAYDVLKDPIFTAENAALTAEGAIFFLMQKTAIAGHAFLVAGWGRIGKLLARKLQGLGASVTVAARNPQDLGMLKALGYAVQVTGQFKNLSRFDGILSTVPCPVFSKSGLPEGVPLLDLAPGGFPPEVPALRLSGLPVRYAPEDAGRLWGEAVLRMLHRKEEVL